jgi:hypothetical protein
VVAATADNNTVYSLRVHSYRADLHHQSELYQTVAMIHSTDQPGDFGMRELAREKMLMG